MGSGDKGAQLGVPGLINLHCHGLVPFLVGSIRQVENETWPSDAHSINREASLGYAEVSILSIGDGAGMTDPVLVVWEGGVPSVPASRGIVGQVRSGTTGRTMAPGTAVISTGGLA